VVALTLIEVLKF